MQKHFQSLAAALLLLLPFAEASDALLKRLKPKGYVNDFAQVIPAGDEARIKAVIVELEEKTGAEIAVVTLQSLEGSEINGFTTRLFNKWGIGKAGKDNGLMFLCAMSDRKMRIEVGYGLEGIITDSKAGVIRRDVITPHFKAGNPEAGILAGIKALSAEVAHEYGTSLTKAERIRLRRGDFNWGILWTLLFIGGLIGLAIYSGYKNGFQPQRRGRYTWDGNYGQGSGSSRWGGGSGFGGGGGFGGFGGGMSGGGGSSGGW